MKGVIAHQHRRADHTRGLTRRRWLQTTASAAGALAWARAARSNDGATSRPGLKIGMCDWTMQKRNDPEVFKLAAEIGLDGVEVDVGSAENRLRLRRPEIQKTFLNHAAKHHLRIPSVGLLELNHVPLMSEPVAALWTADAFKVAKALGADCVLVPFFAKGELKADNKQDMARVSEVLKELAPRAAKAGVTIGLETYLSAEDHLEIMKQVKSPALKVYYDVFNAAHAGHDPIRELELLGRDRICQIHFKDWPYLEAGGGSVDWPAVARQIRKIGYQGWIVLEIGSSSGDLVADTKKNMDYVRRIFA